MSTLIFLHLPRTGGSSFGAALEREYPPGTVYHMDPYGLRGSVLAYQRMDAAERARIRVVKGHMGYGLHEHLDGPCTCLTIMRHPVPRVVSEYRYARERPPHHQYDYIRENGVSLEAYVRTGVSTGGDNQMVRLLAGADDVSAGPHHFPVVPFGGCTRDMLERAKANLAECMVGLTEHLPEFVRRCAECFDWCSPALPRLNRTRSGPDPAALAPSTMAAIRDHNRLDIELYQYAITLAERSWEALSTAS